jgi:hypothetical protein
MKVLEDGQVGRPDYIKTIVGEFFIHFTVPLAYYTRRHGNEDWVCPP